MVLEKYKALAFIACDKLALLSIISHRSSVPVSYLQESTSLREKPFTNGSPLLCWVFIYVYLKLFVDFYCLKINN